MDRLKKHRLTYLATPFTLFKGGLNEAFQSASALAACLMRAGIPVFCPIAHSYPIAKYGGIDPTWHEFWLSGDKPLMEAADALVVGMMDGWDQSRGVSEEINVFRTADKPIYFLNPETLEVSDAA